MRRAGLFVLLLATALACALGHAPGTAAVLDQHVPVAGDTTTMDMLEKMLGGVSGDDPMAWFGHVLSSVAAWTHGVEPAADGDEDDVALMPGDVSVPGPYFRFIPPFVTAVRDDTPAQWAAPCFATNTAHVTRAADGVRTLHVTASQPRDALCADLYLLATTEGVRVLRVFTHGEHTVEWTPSKHATAADAAWTARNGIRVFRFLRGPLGVAADVAATVELFLPAMRKGHAGVPAATQARNVEFLRDYAGVHMPRRHTNVVHVEKASIKSGDFLAIMRLDGLDDMEAVGMGAHTGHTASVLWMDDGELYVVESTSTTNYWRKDNIQRNRWEDWLALAHAADYQVLHVPLSAEARARFNVTAAREFFATVENVPYGFKNYLFCWLDTPRDNMPFNLSPELIEVGFSIADKLASVGSMWNLAFAHRLGVEGGTLDTVSTYEHAAARGISFANLITMPERDEWRYELPDGRHVPQMVCDVFVCSLWKAGGLFGELADDIQCTEFTNWDAYSLAIFDPSPERPPQCVAADPDNTFCQLMGDYSLRLPEWNSVRPYAHMAERCPTLPFHPHQSGC